jgi:hypothetical protein
LQYFPKLPLIEERKVLGKIRSGSLSMRTNRIVPLAFAASLLAVLGAQPGLAQDKPLTPQRQKMKDCAVKWKDEKAKTNVKGREAYRTFLSSCMKA